MGCAEKRQSQRPENRVEIADIFRRCAQYLNAENGFNRNQLRIWDDIQKCRTAALGGHMDNCSECGLAKPSYNSCRNRHCPKCQSLSQALWIAKRKERVLPTRHFHVVFTMPAQLRPLAQDNPRAMYDMLFQCAAQTLQTLIRDKKRIGGTAAITMVLHTWTRQMVFHPHVHCIVSGGGYDAKTNTWQETRGEYLLPGNVMAAMFRGKLLSKLKNAQKGNHLRLKGRTASLQDPDNLKQFVDKLYKKNWVVYAKRSFGSASQVIEYLGRYTHRVAMSNQRLISVNDQNVVFYTKNGKTASLTPKEFARRFLNHALPRSFVKIRHYGLNAGTNVNTKLAAAKKLLQCDSKETAVQSEVEQLSWQELLYELTGVDYSICPKCKTGRLTRMPLPENPITTEWDTS